MEGALRLWTEIARGLRAAGYDKVVPEYLRLSRMLAQTRMTEMLHGKREAEHWEQLRMLGTEALQSLGPLAEAARLLAELPTEMRAVAPGGEGSGEGQPAAESETPLITVEEEIVEAEAMMVNEPAVQAKDRSTKKATPRKTAAKKPSGKKKRK